MKFKFFFFFLIFSIGLFFFITPLKFSDSYLYIKFLHISSVICWMAGLFYLPRLYVYHSRTAIKSDGSELFKVMEYKLLKIIMNPAMMISWITGFWLSYYIYFFQGTWLYIKILMVFFMSAFHGFLSYSCRQFKKDLRPFSEKTWRILNELPTILLLIVVYCVVFKPFS